MSAPSPSFMDRWRAQRQRKKLFERMADVTFSKLGEADFQAIPDAWLVGPESRQRMDLRDVHSISSTSPKYFHVNTDSRKTENARDIVQCKATVEGVIQSPKETSADVSLLELLAIQGYEYRWGQLYRRTKALHAQEREAGEPGKDPAVFAMMVGAFTKGGKRLQAEVLKSLSPEEVVRPWERPVVLPERINQIANIVSPQAPDAAPRQVQSMAELVALIGTVEMKIQLREQLAGNGQAQQAPARGMRAGS